MRVQVKGKMLYFIIIRKNEYKDRKFKIKVNYSIET